MVISLTFEKDNKTDIAVASAIDELFTELFAIAEREPREIKDYYQINYFFELVDSKDLESFVDSLK